LLWNLLCFTCSFESISCLWSEMSSTRKSCCALMRSGTPLGSSSVSRERLALRSILSEPLERLLLRLLLLLDRALDSDRSLDLDLDRRRVRERRRDLERVREREREDSDSDVSSAILQTLDSK
jgi:hypothetical protein